MSYGLRNGNHCCFEGYVCDLGKVLLNYTDISLKYGGMMSFLEKCKWKQEK